MSDRVVFGLDMISQIALVFDDSLFPLQDLSLTLVVHMFIFKNVHYKLIISQGKKLHVPLGKGCIKDFYNSR